MAVGKKPPENGALQAKLQQSRKLPSSNPAGGRGPHQVRIALRMKGRIGRRPGRNRASIGRQGENVGLDELALRPLAAALPCARATTLSSRSTPVTARPEYAPQGTGGGAAARAEFQHGLTGRGGHGGGQHHCIQPERKPSCGV